MRKRKKKKKMAKETAKMEEKESKLKTKGKTKMMEMMEMKKKDIEKSNKEKRGNMKDGAHLQAGDNVEERAGEKEELIEKLMMEKEKEKK